MQLLVNGTYGIQTQSSLTLELKFLPFTKDFPLPLKLLLRVGGDQPSLSFSIFSKFSIYVNIFAVVKELIL